jgi:hypothetical protein
MRLGGLSYFALKDLCDKAGLKKSGRKDDLVDRLVEEKGARNRYCTTHTYTQTHRLLVQSV